MTTRKCIYRFMKIGKRCISCVKDNENKYCEKHKNKEHKIFEIFEKVLLTDDTFNGNNILKLFEIINNDEDIENQQKEMFFKVCVKYLCYKKEKIIKLINTSDILYINPKHKKDKLLDIIYNIAKNTYTLLNEKDKIIKIQRQWLKKLIKINNITYEGESENLEDPFTFDLISEIPEDIKFYFKDSNEHLYIVNGMEFKYFIDNVGSWNPYTKEPLSDDVKNRLNKFIKYKRLNNEILNEKYSWKTVSQAYTDVSFEMEKYGFYTDVKWFIGLKYNDIKSIIKTFHKISISVPEHIKYFDIKLNKKNEFEYDFCKQILRLFDEANEHYMLCCYFMKSLAHNNVHFYNNLPDWINEISPRDTRFGYTYNVPTSIIYQRTEILPNEVNELAAFYLDRMRRNILLPYNDDIFFS